MRGRSRRVFLKEAFSLLVFYSFVRTLATERLLAEPVSSEFVEWVQSINEISGDLRGGSLSPTEWQRQIEALLSQVSLEDLLRYIDFSKIESRLQYPDLGVDTQPVNFPGLSGLPEGLTFYSKLFGMEQDRAIIPHGHRHMTSAHLVLGGHFHLRQYDRIDDVDDSLIVKPTIDAFVGPGEASSISDEKNNVHWLVAQGGRSYTLDIIVTGLTESGPAYLIDNLDPMNAEKLDGGLVRMRKLSVKEALKLYGKDHHGR